MNKKTIITIIVVVAVIIGVTVYWQFFGGSSPFTNQSASVLDSQNDEVRVMTALHQFKNGEHIVAGQVDLPTPCHTLSNKVVIAESNPEQVTIKFTTSAGNSDLCAQVMTTTKYKINFTASQNASIKATWNGAPVQFNLVPVPAGEDIDSFETFIKG